MDKIFGYENFLNEIIWKSGVVKGAKTNSKKYGRITDSILFYSKSRNHKFKTPFRPIDVNSPKNKYIHKDQDGRLYSRDNPLGDYSEESIEQFKKAGRIYYTKSGKPQLIRYLDEVEGIAIGNLWEDINYINQVAKERIGYPTQKPRALLKRIIEASSKEGDIVADFFMGGGTALAVAQSLGRRFIGSDISRVAVSVTLDRLVKDAEEMTGQKASFSKEMKKTQGKVIVDQKVPDIYVYYHGIYPTEKFENLSQDAFDSFVLTCFGASKNTVDDGVTGFKTQFEPTLVGPASPNEKLSVERVKRFVQSVVERHIQGNQRYTLTMIAWQFDPSVKEYCRQLLKGFFKKLQANGVVLEIEMIPIRSKQFRERIATTYGVPDDDKEKLMQFVESPIINEIVLRKVDGQKLTYRFEALAKSSRDRRLEFISRSKSPVPYYFCTRRSFRVLVSLNMETYYALGLLHSCS